MHSTGFSGTFAAPSRELPVSRRGARMRANAVPGQISVLDVGFGMPRLFNYLPNYIIIFNYGLAPFFFVESSFRQEEPQVVAPTGGR
jgi:hypothetical protein